MTDIERLWRRIKETANDLGERGEMPSRGRAEAIVAGLARQENANLTVEARDVLAVELIALLAESHAQVTR